MEIFNKTLYTFVDFLKKTYPETINNVGDYYNIIREGDKYLIEYEQRWQVINGKFNTESMENEKLLCRTYVTLGNIIFSEENQILPNVNLRAHGMMKM